MGSRSPRRDAIHPGGCRMASDASGVGPWSTRVGRDPYPSSQLLASCDVPAWLARWAQPDPLFAAAVRRETISADAAQAEERRQADFRPPSALFGRKFGEFTRTINGLSKSFVEAISRCGKIVGAML